MARLVDLINVVVRRVFVSMVVGIRGVAVAGLGKAIGSRMAAP